MRIELKIEGNSLTDLNINYLKVILNKIFKTDLSIVYVSSNKDNIIYKDN